MIMLLSLLLCMMSPGFGVTSATPNEAVEKVLLNDAVGERIVQAEVILLKEDMSWRGTRR